MCDFCGKLNCHGSHCQERARYGAICGELNCHGSHCQERARYGAICGKLNCPGSHCQEKAIYGIICGEINCHGSHCQGRTRYVGICGKLNCDLHKCEVCGMMHNTSFHINAMKTSSFLESFFASMKQRIGEREFLSKNNAVCNPLLKEIVNIIIVYL